MVMILTILAGAMGVFVLIALVGSTGQNLMDRLVEWIYNQKEK